MQMPLICNFFFPQIEEANKKIVDFFCTGYPMYSVLIHAIGVGSNFWTDYRYFCHLLPSPSRSRINKSRKENNNYYENDDIKKENDNDNKDKSKNKTEKSTSARVAKKRWQEYEELQMFFCKTSVIIAVIV